ncbi:hypothetical protein RAS1_35960 [Phycisphaerae bacterium RAS1]|nr:hypothetical protein RAS1_35960 [Phycisphaerae bacterium RAS1]
MRVIVTGMNGTVAPALGHALRGRGVEVIGWNRRTDAPESAAFHAGLKRVRESLGEGER